MILTGRSMLIRLVSLDKKKIQPVLLTMYRIAGKFGGLAVCLSTAKLKSTNFFSVCMYIWRYRTIPPNLNPPIVLKTSFGAKLPNLKTANISGYTVYRLLSDKLMDLTMLLLIFVLLIISVIYLILVCLISEKVSVICGIVVNLWVGR